MHLQKELLAFTIKIKTREELHYVRTVRGILFAWQYVKHLGGVLNFEPITEKYELFESSIYAKNYSSESEIDEEEEMAQQEKFGITEQFKRKCNLFEKLFVEKRKKLNKKKQKTKNYKCNVSSDSNESSEESSNDSSSEDD